MISLHTTLPHYRIKENILNLLNILNRKDSLYFACIETNALFTAGQPKRYNLWSCQMARDALHYRLDTFGSKLYRQIAGIPIGTKCVPLFADVLFCFVV